MLRSGVELTITTFGTLLMAGADARDYALVHEVTLHSSICDFANAEEMPQVLVMSRCDYCCYNSFAPAAACLCLCKAPHQITL